MAASGDFVRMELSRYITKGEAKLLTCGKAKRSPVWEHFRRVEFRGVITNYVACCNCLKVYTFDKTGSTKSLLSHKCTRKQSTGGSGRQLTIDHEVGPIMIFI